MKLFSQTIYKEHDYVKLQEGFKKTVDMIKNSNSETFDAAVNYAELWVDFVAFDEGFYYLDKWYNIFLAKITGMYRYHQNFCDSINFKVEYIKNMIEDKEKELHSTKKIGFQKHK